VRKTLFLICLFFFYTCDSDFQLNKKITVNEFIEDELKSFSWNQVDQYPVFENCLNFNDTAQKNNCFVETITENFRINLKKNNLVLNRTLVDTINLVLKIDKKGNIGIQSMTTRDENIKYKEIISISFDSTMNDLPKLYPAIKRGQEVDIIFNLPILISTEE
jgi:hypothetical protein|tara:strand:- start:3914 stop:4399 length:486 start_codon:yes stop_codon:yes gene_type:complete